MQIVNHIKPGIGDTDHPYMTGAWTPNFDEIDADDLEVTGSNVEFKDIVIRNK